MLLASILSLGVVCVMSFAGSAPAAAATKTTRSVVNAVWTITDGCVETSVSLSSTQTGSGPPTTSFFLNQSQTCEDPLRVLPVLSLEGAGYTGGRLQVNANFTKARLVATIPVTCYAYEIGACDQDLYNPGSVSLNLSWNSTGGTTIQFTTDDGFTCTARYGTATGSILLGGGVNLLASDGGTLLSDPTETNVQRCTRS